MSLCRCAQVSRAWNVLALDGSNWQKIDLFEFQTDVEVNFKHFEGENMCFFFKNIYFSGSSDRKYFTEMWWFLTTN